MNQISNTEFTEECFDAFETLAQKPCSEADTRPILKHDEPVETHTSMRQQERYLVRWRMAIVFDNGKGENTFHGKVNDISMGGISIYCDHNIFHKGIVTLSLTVPPLNITQTGRILEIKCRMVYTILSRNSFRIGLQFIRFNTGDEEFLESRLKSNHTLYRDAGSSRD
jgi:PilZ domain